MRRQIEGQVGWLAENTQLLGRARVDWRRNCRQHTKSGVTASRGQPFRARGTLDLRLCLGGKEPLKRGPCLLIDRDPSVLTKGILVRPAH